MSLQCRYVQMQHRPLYCNVGQNRPKVKKQAKKAENVVNSRCSSSSCRVDTFRCNTCLCSVDTFRSSIFLGLCSETRPETAQPLPVVYCRHIHRGSIGLCSVDTTRCSSCSPLQGTHLQEQYRPLQCRNVQMQPCVYLKNSTCIYFHCKRFGMHFPLSTGWDKTRVDESTVYYWQKFLAVEHILIAVGAALQLPVQITRRGSAPPFLYVQRRQVVII